MTESPAGERCCESPQLCWRGTQENAAIVCVSCSFVLADDGQLADWVDPDQIAWQQEVAESSGENTEENITAPIKSSESNS